MLLSTLPGLPGQTFEVSGLVHAEATLAALGGGNTRKMVESLAKQAAGLGADAVVDVKTVLGGEHGNCVMTGTAVRILRTPS